MNISNGYVVMVNALHQCRRTLIQVISGILKTKGSNIIQSGPLHLSFEFLFQNLRASVKREDLFLLKER